MNLRVFWVLKVIFLTVQLANASDLNCVQEKIRSNLLGAQFLHGLNSAFHHLPMIERAQEILVQVGEKNPQNAQKKIAAWLSIVEQTHLRRRDAPKVLERLKKYYYREHVITEDDFPESYFELQKKIDREKGLGDVYIPREQRAARKRRAIQDQKKSLDAWIEYLSGSDAPYPMWAKVWAFDGMARIGKLDAETGKVTSRNRQTVAPFVELNRGALSLTIEAVEKRLQAKQKSLNYAEIEPNGELRELVQGGNFGKIYGWYMHALTRNELDLKMTEGAWVKYPRGSDPWELIQLLQCKNTGWCTVAASTAHEHVRDGDFYVYYSHDALSRPNHPRIAIRMKGDQIVEVRGIGPSQELDSSISVTGILDQKLKEFGIEGERFLKRSSDMKRLSQIEQKTEALEELTESELRFLYEIDSKIEGFGYDAGPRIHEVRDKRDKRKDLASLFHIKPEEVSLTSEEALSGTRKIHYGELDLDDLESIEGRKLLERQYGDLVLSNLKRAHDFILSKEMHGDIYLQSLETAQGLKLPEVHYGKLDLMSLKKAQGITFPKEMHGNLFLPVQLKGKVRIPKGAQVSWVE